MPCTRRLTVGLLLVTSLVTVFGLTAASALAAPVSAARTTTAGTGSFGNWRAAQRVAGFALQRPTKTYGLTRTDGIMVDRCPVNGEQRKRDVIASYGSYQHRLLGIQQNNSGGPCGNFGAARKLHTYHINGVKARLWGVCQMASTPSCHARKIWLFLIWRKDGVYYQATSHNVWRATIVGFAGALTAVRDHHHH